MSSQLAFLAMFLVSAAALGMASLSLALALGLAVLCALACLVGPRLHLDSGRQWLTSAMGAGAGYGAAAIMHEPVAQALGDGWTRVSAAALIAAAARSLLVDPRGGGLVTVALAMGALVATGETRNRGYAWFVAAFLTAAVAALRTRPKRPRFDGQGRRVLMGALIVSVAALLGACTVAGVQRLHAFLSNRARWHAYTWRPRVGFSEKMELGALDGLLDSDEVVLRVRGRHVDYLRGAVLDEYEAGRWIRSERATLEMAADFGQAPDQSDARYLSSPVALPPGPEEVDIAAVSERTSRIFTPLAARHMVVQPGPVLVDDLGAIKRASEHGVISVHLQRGERDRAPLSEPRASDLYIPRRLRGVLQLLALSWTQGATGNVAKLEAIEEHLRRDYGYARAFTRTQASDPVVDFLTGDKRGHCEYFASALALLGRAAGVPTRLVTGYRVGEMSPFGYEVVRERNAHAWVEAWTDGEGWMTRDATPREALPQNLVHRASYAGSLVDGARVAYDEVTGWLAERSVEQTAFAWVLGFIILGWIIARGARGRRLAARAADSEGQPLAPLFELLATLAREGDVHRPDETLERFAARVHERRAAQLLLRYSAFRYGGHGDLRDLADQVARYRQRRASR